MPLSLDDLRRALEANPNDAAVYLNYARSHLHAGNTSEALIAFFRVTQLMPGNVDAHAWCDSLAAQLNLSGLYEGARVMERFANHHCGPGYRWAVELVEMYEFDPDQPPATYMAALLNFCQTPLAVVELTVLAYQYRVRLLTETAAVPNVPRIMFRKVIEENVLRQQDSLLSLLNTAVDNGLIEVSGNSLRYVGPGPKAGNVNMLVATQTFGAIYGPCRGPTDTT